MKHRLSASVRWLHGKAKTSCNLIAGILLFLIDFTVATCHMIGRLFPFLLAMGLALGLGGILGVFLVEFNNNLIGSFFHRPFEADIENFTRLLSTGNSMFGYSGGIFSCYLIWNLWGKTLKPIFADCWKYVTFPFRRKNYGWFSRGVAAWAGSTGAGSTIEPGALPDHYEPHSWLRELHGLVVQVKDGPTLRLLVRDGRVHVRLAVTDQGG